MDLIPTLQKEAIEAAKKSSTSNVLKRVDLDGDYLPADRFQQMIEMAVNEMGGSNGKHYIMWSLESPNLISLDAKEVHTGIYFVRQNDRQNDEDTVGTHSWAGLYKLEHGGDTFYMVGEFGQGDGYKFRKSYATIGTSKEKVLALIDFLQKEETAAKRALAPKHIFTPRGGRSPRPSYDWDKVILPEDIRKSLQMNFSTFFKGPEAYEKAEVAYRRGILLCGAPGTGKTSILKAVMSQYPEVPFFIFEKTFDDVYVEDLRSLFAEAAKLQPAVVVIEDIDRLVDSNSFPLQDLLNVLDGLGTSTGVMTIATANNEQNLDPALVERPSRFDLVVRIPMPDQEHREGYIKDRSKSLDIVLDVEQLQELLKVTSKYTMAQMQELFTGAVLSAFSENAKVGYVHLQVSVKSMTNSLKVARKEEGKTKAGFGRSED